MDEKVFFGFAALAMIEMGVAPPDAVWRWAGIRNPFVALINAGREIEMARLGLRKRGINVFLESH